MALLSSPSKISLSFQFRPSMNELPMTVDITLSEEKPRKIKNESSQNGPELKHVPVVRNLNLSRQDRGKLEQYFQSCTFRPPLVYMTKLCLCLNYSTFSKSAFESILFSLFFSLFSHQETTETQAQNDISAQERPNSN